AFSVLFAFFFVPYVKQVAKHRYLMGTNYDADAARDEVMRALAEAHEGVDLQGHRFIAGGQEVLRGIFDPPTSFFWVAAPVDAGREGGKIVEALRGRLDQVPRKEGGSSPWLWRGVTFIAFGLVLALAALGSTVPGLLPFDDPVDDFDLIHAAWTGDETRVRSLLAQGVDPDARDASRRTSLHFAAVGGDTGIVEALLDAGANVDAKDDDQRTPLHLAVYNGQREIVELLLSRGADVRGRDKDDRTPRDIAEAQNNTPLLDLLERKAKSRSR
ncbi:MAG: ankyrin repeat domain-containing protein, partial [Planctomycetota bacterium]